MLIEQGEKERDHSGTKRTVSALTAWTAASLFYRMFLSYQGDSAVLCEAFILFTTSVIGTVPQEICCGMWWRGAILHIMKCRSGKDTKLHLSLILLV